MSPEEKERQHRIDESLKIFRAQRAARQGQEAQEAQSGIVELDESEETEQKVARAEAEEDRILFAKMNALEKEKGGSEEGKGFTFPYLMDADQSVYPQFGATKTPHTYILKSTKNGPVVQYIGAIDDNYSDPALVKNRYVENAVDRLLKGEPIEIEKTKAIGCSIKI